MTLSEPIIVWRPEDDPNIRPPLRGGQVYRPDILNVIEASIDGLNGELRALSLDIHDHPELKFEEKCVVSHHATCHSYSQMPKDIVTDMPMTHTPHSWKNMVSQLQKSSS